VYYEEQLLVYSLEIPGATICRVKEYLLYFESIKGRKSAQAGNNFGKVLFVSEIILESKNCQKKPVTTNQKSG